MNGIKKEMNVLRKTLRKDADYYLGWQSNIAMSFFDEAKRKKVKVSSATLHEVCNNAAKNFLNLLCK